MGKTNGSNQRPAGMPATPPKGGTTPPEGGTMPPKGGTMPPKGGTTSATSVTRRVVKVVLEVPLLEDSGQRALEVGTRVDHRLNVAESEAYRALQNALADDGTLGEGYRRVATGEPLRWLCQRLGEALARATESGA